MADTSDEDISLVTNERSPRKRRKRKSRKKKSTDDTNTCFYSNLENGKSEKQNKTYTNFFSKANKKSSENSESNNHTDDASFRNEGNDDIRNDFYSNSETKLRPSTRSGRLQDVKQQHSPYEPSHPSKHLTHDASDTSASLFDTHDPLTSTCNQKNDRSNSLENCTKNMENTKITKTETKRQLNDNSPRQSERGRKFEKHQRQNRSNSREFVDSENKRKSFSAFMDLSQSHTVHTSYKNSHLLLKLREKDKHADDTDLMSTKGKNVDEKTDYSKDKSSVNETSSKINDVERKKTGYNDTNANNKLSQMDENKVTENSIGEKFVRRLKEDKQLDRKTYKSPRRFSGRSLSRERRKSAKSSGPSENLTDKPNDVEPEIENDHKKEYDKSENISDIEMKKTELPNKLMSRSIQTSMQLLDIGNNDKSCDNAATNTESNVAIVPCIVEHTLKDHSKSDTLSEKCMEEKSISPHSSESEEFKTPKQSPLPERKSIDEILPEPSTKKEDSKKDNETDKKSPKLSFLAVVALKRKLAKQKKKKRKLSEDNSNKGKSEKLPEVSKADIIPPEVSDKPEESKLENEKYIASFYLENETNFNIGTVSYLPETDILDVDEVIEDHSNKDKKLSFDIISEPVASDTSLSDSYINKHRQIAKRRQSEVFREKRAKALTYCKKFVAFLFSHIGLCSVMVAYAILGGFIFRAIEGPFEIETKIKVVKERENTRNQIMELATELNLNKRSWENVSKEIDDLLNAFQTEVYIATDIHGFNNENSNEEAKAEQWSFSSSLLFAITVMTTIGYGHVAPKTDTGRIVTIGYAVLGIPLTLLCLTNIGDLMATGFRMLYARVCCGVCCLLFTPSRRRMPDPEKASGSIEYQEGKSTDKSPEVINVPTSVCILLMTSYILLGTLLFSIWEGWDAITGTYFSFITLSTIGFGDVVPGTAMNQWDDEEKLVLCAMYLVFGLSLIAMCFNLVQEDVKAKCRWLGSKIGIIDESK